VTEEYVARLRLAYEAFADGGVEAILDRVSPDFQIRDRESAPDRATMVGGEGITELVRLNMEVFDELEFEPTEFIDRGETVVVVLRMRVRGRSSGVPIDSETVHAWEFSEGRAVCMQIYADRQRALVALGLED
jgi:ketosteroid isomerase-like protein